MKSFQLLSTETAVSSVSLLYCWRSTPYVSYNRGEEQTR